MDWVQVAVAGTEMEMELLRGRLEGSGLAVRVEPTGPFGSTTVFGALPRVGGGYRLLVEAGQAQVARVLLEPEEEHGEEQGEPE